MQQRVISILLFLTLISPRLTAADVFVEAERFADYGGWTLDQQFIDQMGSSYLLAHGLGVAVGDAKTEVVVPEDGVYNVYARTYNWTSPWTGDKGPGAFRIIVGGKSLPATLGVTGNAWQWQKAGSMKLQKGKASLRLHDLTGFDGRCDAVLLTTDGADPNEFSAQRMAALRRSCQAIVADSLQDYDFVVVGGGVAGMCAAASAARLGCRVALVGDRLVWGGNNSSEVRVHLGGISETGLYPALGRLLREFGPSEGGNAMPASFYEDSKKDSFLTSQNRLTLFAGWRAVGVEKTGSNIAAVRIRNVVSGAVVSLKAPLYADCTGDGNLGFLAGADWTMGRESRSEYGESLAPEKPDSTVMGASVQWYSENGRRATRFPEFRYGIDFNDGNAERVTKGEWTWETGMNLNQITDAERIRDYGLLVVYSNWSWLKNHDRDRKEYSHRKLQWVASVLGKRESRRLLGDYVLSQDDIDKDVQHEDATFTTTWAIDLHFADSVNSSRFPGGEFKTRTVHRWIYPYAVPYRCLYSRNVDNLFMAGRDISTTHVALGTTRVMRTTGMMGEVVGMAAEICTVRQCKPRDVYRKYLPELKSLMQNGVGRGDLKDNQHYNEPNKNLKRPRAFMENKK